MSPIGLWVVLAAVPLHDAKTGLTLDLDRGAVKGCWYFPEAIAQAAPCQDAEAMAPVVEKVRGHGRLIGMGRFTLGRTGGLVLTLAADMDNAGDASAAELRDFARGYHGAVGKSFAVAPFDETALRRLTTAGTTTVQFAVRTTKGGPGTADTQTYLLGKDDEMLVVAFQTVPEDFDELLKHELQLRQSIVLASQRAGFGEEMNPYHAGRMVGALVGIACVGAVLALGVVLIVVLARRSTRSPAPPPPPPPPAA